MLIHKIEISDTVLSCEQVLIDTCKEYNINYETCELYQYAILNESIVSNIVDIIKAIFRKVIAILVKAFKFIVNILKTAIQKASEIFKKLFNIKTKSDVKVKVGIISKPGTTEEKTFTNPQDIVKAFKQSHQNFNNEITKLERETLGFTKRMENQVSREVAKEDYIEGLLEKVIYNKGLTSSGNNNFYKKLGVYDKNTDEKTFDEDGNTQGNDRASHQQINTFDFLNTKEMELVLESKNLCKSFEVFKSNSITRLIDHASEVYNNKDIKDYDAHKKAMNDVMKTAGSLYHKYKIKYEDLGRYLSCKYFPSFDNLNKTEKESAIREWLKLRINWNNGMIGLLRVMIIKNQQLLSISNQSMEAILKDLDKGDIGGIRWALMNNTDIVSSDMRIIDGRSIGLGVICIANEMVDDELSSSDAFKSNANAGAYISLFDFEHNDKAITYMSKYDLTIVAHGGDDEENKKWYIQKTCAPDKSYPGEYYHKYTDVVEYLRYVVKKGFKRINIVSCNPGHYKLPEDLVLSKKVIIRMSMTNTLADH